MYHQLKHYETLHFAAPFICMIRIILKVRHTGLPNQH
jgi:hypothetical protein